MKKYILTLIFSLTSLGGEASTQGLVKEFLEKNYLLKSNKLSVDEAAQEYNALWASKTYFLNFSAGFNSTPSRSANREASDFEAGDFDNYNLSLNKTFNWGGEVSFNNRYNALKQINNFTQDVSYSQNMGRNFFGKSFKLELSMAGINKEKTEVIVKGANQGLLQKFYMTFISAKFNRTMVNLQTEAKKRAVKRKNNIDKRVEAGILEKVDAYRAEIAVMAKEEDIKNARFTLNENLQEVSTGVHRKVGESEVPYFSLRKVSLPGDVKGGLESNFKLEEKKKEIYFIKENLKKIKRGFLPDINIRLSYKTEGSGFELTDTLKEGSLNNGGNLAGAVSLVIPLGYEQNKVDQSAKRIALNIQRYEMKNLRSELDNMNGGLKDRVEIIRKNIASATKRRRISAKTLEEQNKLYLKGRAPLDSVVISEEQLILNEMRLAQYLLQLEQILVSQSILYGELESYLLSRESN